MSPHRCNTRSSADEHVKKKLGKNKCMFGALFSRLKLVSQNASPHCKEENELALKLFWPEITCTKKGIQNGSRGIASEPLIRVGPGWAAETAADPNFTKHTLACLALFYPAETGFTKRFAAVQGGK